MTLASSLALSYYKKIADINPEHEIFLVQHQETGKFYVQKVLDVYNHAVFQQLTAHPVPGTPRIYEAVENDSRLIVIEEYIPGTTLQELLDTEGTLPEAQVIEYMIQLCSVLHSLHSCNPPIVHRDIKPSNVIITPDGIMKLLDFNAARCADGTAVKDTVLLGTPGFAAPEQYGFGTSDAQTDLYAVGILMNLLLTGQLSHECTVSSALEPVIRKCIMMERSQRYSSALEVRDALEKLRGNTSQQKNTAEWMSFLPPGFRRGNLLSILLSSIGYILVFWCCLTMEVKNAAVQVQEFERILSLLLMLGVIFFSADYRNIQSRIPLCKNKNFFLRITGIVLVDFLLFFFCVLVLTVYESLLN